MLGKGDKPELTLNQYPSGEPQSAVLKGIVKNTKLPILARWTQLYKTKLGTKEDYVMHIPSYIRRGKKIKFRFLKPSTDLIDSMEKLILFFHQYGKSKNFKKKNLHIRPYLGKRFPVVATMKKTNNNTVSYTHLTLPTIHLV